MTQFQFSQVLICMKHRTEILPAMSNVTTIPLPKQSRKKKNKTGVALSAHANLRRWYQVEVSYSGNGECTIASLAWAQSPNSLPLGTPRGFVCSKTPSPPQHTKLH